MRRTTAGIAVVMMMVAVQPGSAQVTLGARAGAVISDLSLETEEVPPDLESSTGLVVGGFVDVPLSGGLSFQPGLQYAQKGAELTDEDNGMTFTLGLGLDYVEVPLLLRYAFPTDGGVGVHLYGGPALAFESSCKVSLQAEGFDASFDCDQGEEQDIEVETKSFDLGAMFGGGIALPLGSASLLVEAFYNLGLINILDSASDEDSAKNRAFYVTAGLGFPLS